MKKACFLFTVLLTCRIVSAQGKLYVELPPMPEAVTNNAVTAATVNDTPFVYSFCGLDNTKIWSGIHLKAWRMNTISGEWQALPPVPDPEGGKIAAAASTVKNKVYVIGGYHVAPNGSETSSAKVHRFDPAANAWLPDGAPLPKPVDDHVQAVWRDSLIYVVTGWSNTGNVPDVQIYNPATDTWLSGSAVPNNVNYKVFGASGVIIGDVIYYCGGAAAGINFPASSYFRTGVINPSNPAQITWSGFSSPAAKGYRMAAAIKFGTAVWVGGSDVTYNYNGISYDGSAGVPALARRKRFFPWNGALTNEEDTTALPAIMDLRGAAQIDGGYFITAGGMEPGQKVSKRVFGYTWAEALDANTPASEKDFRLFPNPVSGELTVEYDGGGTLKAQLFDALGREMMAVSGTRSLKIPTTRLARGIYWIRLFSGDRLIGIRKVMTTGL